MANPTRKDQREAEAKKPPPKKKPDPAPSVPGAVKAIKDRKKLLDDI
jgi:hypothetical protein